MKTFLATLLALGLIASGAGAGYCPPGSAHGPQPQHFSKPSAKLLKPTAEAPAPVEAPAAPAAEPLPAPEPVPQK